MLAYSDSDYIIIVDVGAGVTRIYCVMLARALSIDFLCLCALGFAFWPHDQP